VPDNLRSAVKKSGREPVINRHYAEFAEHYGTAIVPARAYRPKDKAKVEVAVQIVQRWILACLRHRTFFSLADLNRAIAELLEELNRRPFKRLPGCRRQRFEHIEKDTLMPLPDTPYEFADWSPPQRVGNDYHVCVNGHWYSVSYRLVGKPVEARLTRATVEFFHAHQRVAAHVRNEDVGGHTTDPAHMPVAHQAQANRTPERYQAWAENIGPNVLAVVRKQFERKLPMLGLPACESLYRLARQYGAEKLEEAACRAMEIKSPTVKSIKSLLASKRLTRGRDDDPVQGGLPPHHNVRGPDYYAQPGDISC